ncbi:MAG TPA: hypothetical protein VHB48_08225 [Chitinophagaceae bacterium]|nr:hypothetical protein [Chitinophagaceae bacterium]
MKLTTLLIIISACCTTAYSQPGKLIVFDNFDNNNHDWAVNTSGDAIYTINSGKYVMENFDGKVRWSALHVKLDGSNDFAISCVTSHNSGVTNSGYGLMFGGKDNDNYFVFDIANTGYYRLYEEHNGSITYLINWTKTSYVNQDNYVNNILKVQRSGSTWNLYVNGNWVNSYTARYFYGDLAGFIKSGNQRIEFDNFEVDGYAPGSSTYNNSSYNSNNSYNDDDNNYDNLANGSTFTFSDDFSDNNEIWGDDKEDGDVSKDPYTYIDYDVLTLRSFKGKSIDRSVQFYLDTKATFDISASFERISGETDNSTYGISLEDPTGKSGYAFYISANGYYAIKQLENGTTTGDWKASSYINTGDGTNDIEIKSDGSYWSMYVNGHYVSLISSKYIYHPRIFLISNEDQMVEVDEFDLSGRIKK